MRLQHSKEIRISMTHHYDSSVWYSTRKRSAFSSAICTLVMSGLSAVAVAIIKKIKKSYSADVNNFVHANDAWRFKGAIDCVDDESNFDPLCMPTETLAGDYTKSENPPYSYWYELAHYDSSL